MTMPHTGSESPAEQAKDAARDIASTARDEAGTVMEETREQAARVADEVRQQVSDQVRRQREQAAATLRTAGSELGSMADGQQSALTRQLVRLSSERLRDAADYIDHHGPEELLQDVRTFARRRPGAFLVLAGVAGVAAGRAFRGAAAARSAGNGASTPAVPARPTPGPDTGGTYGSGMSPTDDTLVYSTTTPAVPTGAGFTPEVDLTAQPYAGTGAYTGWERRDG